MSLETLNISNIFIIVIFKIAGSGIELSKISDLKGILESEKVAEVNSPEMQSSGTAKRRKTDTAMRLEFEIDMKKMKEWFEKTESTLALLSADDDDDNNHEEIASTNEKFSEEEQFVLIQVLFSLYLLQMIFIPFFCLSVFSFNKPLTTN